MYLQEIADNLQGANVSSSFLSFILYNIYAEISLFDKFKSLLDALASMLPRDPFAFLTIYFLQIHDYLLL